MGRLKRNQFPSMRRHASGQYVVTLDRQDFYLGRDEAEAAVRHRALVGRWLAGDLPARRAEAAPPTVADVCDAFEAWARSYYVKRGEPTSQIRVIAGALAAVRTLYGPAPAADFGVAALEACQRAWVAAGLTRGGVNRRGSIVRQCWRHAARRGLVPTGAALALGLVKGLAPGRTAAPDRPRVAPADPAAVAAVVAAVRPELGAMIEVQRLSGMRPAEVCGLRPCDLDRSGPVWSYVPGGHKTEHRGRRRTVFLGPRAQAVLAPLLGRAARRRGGEADALFRTRTGRRYSVSSYRSAVYGACDRLGIPRWSPNRLRHAAASEIRARYGIEAARTVLGHATADTTELYAERDLDLARRAAADLG